MATPIKQGSRGDGINFQGTFLTKGGFQGCGSVNVFYQNVAQDRKDDVFYGGFFRPSIYAFVSGMALRFVFRSRTYRASYLRGNFIVATFKVPSQVGVTSRYNGFVFFANVVVSVRELSGKFVRF